MMDDHYLGYTKAVGDILELWDELGVVAPGRTEHYESFAEAMNHFRRKFAGVQSDVHEAGDSMERILRGS